MMDETRFAALVEAYGADPARWPETERGAALRFQMANPQVAARLLAPARALDGLLAESPQGTVSERLVTALLAEAPRAARRPSAVWALAACALLGLALGFAGFRSVGADVADDAWAQAFTDLDDGATEFGG